MGQYLAFESDPLRGDNRAAVGIILGVGGKHEEMSGKPELETTDLHISFFDGY